MQHFAEKIITALATANVDFVVVGGISAVLQGAPIVTQDLDICYSRAPDNLKRLDAALEPTKPRLRNIPEGVPNVFDFRSRMMIKSRWLAELPVRRRSVGRRCDS